jgi:hypothetical protein
VQRRIREHRLGLDAGHARDAKASGIFHRLIEQRGLADSRLAAEHECPTSLLTGVDKEAPEVLDLLVASQQRPTLGAQPDERHTGDHSPA